MKMLVKKVSILPKINNFRIDCKQKGEFLVQMQIYICLGEEKSWGLFNTKNSYSEMGKMANTKG